MQVVVFTLGKEKFSLETRLVHGIEKVMTITAVPKSASYIKGLANLRGTIISIIDIKSYLNMQRLNDEENIIIIELGDERVGILVDNVQEVIEISGDQIEASANCPKYIKGIINLGDSIVTLLDGELLFK